MQTVSMPFGGGLVGPREASTHFTRQHHYYYAPSSDPLQHTQTVPRSSRAGSSPSATYRNLNRNAVAPKQHSRPHSPPSPPRDEVGKPSLPSISSLLHIAGPERMGSEAGNSRHSSPSQTQFDRAQQQAASTSHPFSEQYERPPSAQQAHTQGASTALRVSLPPTPPMQPEALVGGVHSPLTISSHSPFNNHNFHHLGQSLNNLDPYTQRQAVSLPSAGSINTVTSASHAKRHSFPGNATSSPYGQPAYTTSPYTSSPGGASVRSYYSADASNYGSGSGLHSQQPLPPNYPPYLPPVQTTLPVPSIGPLSAPASLSAMQSMYQPPQTYTHQHHHYISASSASTFPQNQDRYICPTCNKAFSRPSSLRIHSHSHTGEKPFRCPHMGCGKAFSVRSNMKRHERGCHAAMGGAIQL